MSKVQSCCEVIVDYLVSEGVKYVAGVPGHGILAFLDAFLGKEDKIKIITVKHEQSAIHLADGYYRANGKPMAAFTSVGPGAINTLVGIGTAFADSTAVVVFTANCPTYMFGRGALQAADRNQWNEFTCMVRPIVKHSWQITNVRQLPDVLHRAFRVATSGRPGPVHIELPMDIQASSVEVNELEDVSKYRISSRVSGDELEIRRAAELLRKAQRPVMLLGGGVISANACEEARKLAEYLCIPVVTTVMGKGAIPEDHPLCAFYAGSKASTCGNELMKKADLVVAVGCRFAEWTTSSYKDGMTFKVPPTKIVHIDIDASEIGKNYPVNVGILGDAKAILTELIQITEELTVKVKPEESPYYEEVQKLKLDWEAAKAAQIADVMPMTTSRFLKELREFLDRDAIVVGAAGHAQAQLFQEFPVYQPRTHLSSGAYSTMGFCVPATIGAKLALPERQVVGIAGDGDFLMTCQELATAVQFNIPVVYCVLNNYGWISIRDLQIHHYGPDRTIGTEFTDVSGGAPYNPNFVAMAQSFGAYGEKVEHPENIKPALSRAFQCGKPALVEILTATKFPQSEGALAGWSDFPTPEYIRGRSSG